MNTAYYTEYYTLERENWWFRVREQLIRDQLLRYLPSSTREPDILNVGIATGRSTEMLAELGTVTSVEYDEACAAFTREKLGIPVISASITDLPFENASFDTVCAFDVIEHVEDEVQAVAELKRVCKPGGTIYITVPAYMILWSHHDVVNQHQRRYTMSQIVKLFGLPRQIVYKTYFNSLLFPPILAFRLLSRLLPDRFLRKGSGSDFSIIGQKSLINKILYHVFNTERRLLRLVRFRAGVSLLFMWRNPGA
jgi:SAM-dependent methyltransferase